MTKRFLVKIALPDTGSLTLNRDDNPEEFHHLSRVMRLRIGDTLILANGDGRELDAKILSIENDSLSLEILAARITQAEAISITLCQATLKGAKMDWLIEKITELGITEFHALVTEFTVKTDAASRLERWNRLASSALKQSGNPRLPKIHDAEKLEVVLNSRNWDGFELICLHPEANAPILLGALETACKKNNLRGIVLFLGPEGGFSDLEVKFLKDRGVCTASLGQTILRGETAGIVAAALARQAIAFWAQ